MSERSSTRVLVVGRPSRAAALRDAGFAIRTVNTIAEALEEAGSVDCVVVDATLPDGDGLELFAQLRDVRPELPVVLHPESGSERLASEAFAAGVDDYIADDLAGALPARLEAAIDADSENDRRAEESYRRLVETIGEMVYTVDAEGRIAVVNEAGVDMSGYTREELVGEHVSLLMRDEDIERSRGVIKSLLRGDATTAAYEMTLQTKDGRELLVENHVALLPGEEFRGTVGVLRDISDVDERDRRLRELHGASRDLMAATTSKEIAEQTAAAADGVLDYPLYTVRLLDETAGTLDPVVISERTRETMGERPIYDVEGNAPVARAFREGEFVAYDDVDDLGDEHDRGEVHAVMYLPLGEHGVLSIGATERGAFDESDRQLAEILAANATAALDRAKQRRELEAEHDRLTALFENIPDPTVYVEYVDGEPIVRDVNAAFKETFGYTTEDLEGESVDDYVVPPDRTQEADRYNAEIQNGESLHAEVRRVATDGPRDFLLHVVPHQTDEYNTRGFGIYTDITDRKERERELQRQNKRLEEFASVVSHDLRNPLNVAQGRLELARETGNDEQLDAVARAHDRMERLIEDLLALASQGREVGEDEPVDLSVIAADAWASVDTDGTMLDIADPPTVRADEDRLQQLLENLFRNSVEHAGDAVTVTIGSLDDGFYVADDGQGIAPERRDRIFDSGYSTTDEGTGFGLAIVKQIAEAHGWEVAVAESADGGAIFEFTGVDRVETTPQPRS